MSSTESDDDEPLAKYRKRNGPEEVGQLLPPSLNEDVLVKILLLLPLKDQTRLERVCKLWQSAVIESLKNVKRLELSECLPSDPRWTYRFGGIGIFRSVIDRFGPHLTSVSIPGGKRGRFCQRELLRLSTECPQLRHLSFELTIRSRVAIERLGDQLGQLESLKLNCAVESDDANAYGRQLGIALASMPSLKHLEIECAGGYSQSLRGTILSALPNSIVSLSLINVDSYRLRGRHLADFICSHPALKKFQVKWGWFDGDPPLSTLLAQHCTGLTHLNITETMDAYHPRIEVAFVNDLQSLTQLEEVAVVNNGNFTNSVLEGLCRNCPNVKVLRMGNMRSCSYRGPTNNKYLTLDGLIHLRELKELTCVSLYCFGITVTKEILAALCEGNGAAVEDFYFSTSGEPNGWRKFTEAGVNDFVGAFVDRSRLKSFRIDVDRTGRRVWLKQVTSGWTIVVENVNP